MMGSIHTLLDKAWREAVDASVNERDPAQALSTWVVLLAKLASTNPVKSKPAQDTLDPICVAQAVDEAFDRAARTDIAITKGLKTSELLYSTAVNCWSHYIKLLAVQRPDLAAIKIDSALETAYPADHHHPGEHNDHDLRIVALELKRTLISPDRIIDGLIKLPTPSGPLPK